MKHNNQIIEKRCINDIIDSIPDFIKNANVYSAPIFEKHGTRLYMNENIYGPSPNCLKVLNNTKSSDLYQYSFAGDGLFIEAVGNAFDVDPKKIVVNSGAASVIQQIFKTFIQPNDVIYLPKPGWGYYSGVAQLLNGKVRYYELKETEEGYSFDINSMTKEMIKHSPKVIVITSPNMPTGNEIEKKDIEYIANKFKNSIILLDEAYYGFTDNYQLCGEKLIEEYPNIIVLRTLSKIYGLASVRLGFALCNETLACIIRKSAPLFGVPFVSQIIGKAALDDKEYYKALSLKISKVRDEFINEINNIQGLKAYPSKSNFVLINTGDISPANIEEYLRKNNYLVRNCTGYGLFSHIRISIGKEEQMKEIVNLIRDYVNSKTSIV